MSRKQNGDLTPKGDENSLYMHREESLQGPLPPPHLLEEYDRVHPGLGELLVNGMTEERKHRHFVEKTIFLTLSAGTILSYSFGVLGIAAAVFLAMKGIDWPVILIVAPTGMIPSVLSLFKSKNTPPQP